MRVYLADLGHNQLTVSSDIYPICVANCAAYATAYLESPFPVEYRLFREPQDLKAALEAAPPDVLGLSSFAWNHNLAIQFAEYAKRIHPGVITLMGGPNYPLTPSEQESWLRGMPAIDIAVRGPTYEGERAFLHIMQRLVECRGALEEVQAEPVPGNHWIDRRTGAFVRGPEVERIRDLDEIPSPYLTGWMDPYYETGYFPMLQIARGCPFSCQFCNSSVKENSKVFAHSVQNVCDDLLHIAQRVKPELPVCFADDNFGMYPRDEEVADYLGYLQEKFGWPKYIRTTTGKNQAERIIRVMRKVRGAMPMTSAVQSLNPVVLENIKRSNIKLETYAEIQKEVRAQGMQSYGELILSMPGETLESFMQAVRDLLATGVTRISAHQLMLLHGAPLANPESRRRFQLKTKFRIVARNLGNYLGEPVVEVEEMVVDTPTFPIAHYYEARIFHLLLTIYYYEGNFEEAFEFARHHGVNAYDLIVLMQQMLPEAPAPFRQVIADFRRESEEELFDTPEECIAFAKAHFDKLVDGTLGGNLLSKYSMLARFFTTPATLDFLEQVIARATGITRPEAEAGLRAVMEYLRGVVLHVPFAETLERAPAWATEFDIEAWRADGYVRPLECYRLDRPVRYRTAVEPERKSMIATRLKTFGEHAAGLGKFTRTLFARDLRRRVIEAARLASLCSGVVFA
jgi:radical SAM superfamily enzyme YgiQ (UPF0313 family)